MPEKLENIWKNPDGTFKKGHPGIGGRPKGKTLKEFAREYLESLPDEEKTQYLASLPPDLVWKMAEGNPKQENDTEVKATIQVVVPQAVAESFNIHATNDETGGSDTE